MGGCATHPQNVPGEEILPGGKFEEQAGEEDIFDPMEQMSVEQQGGGFMTYSGYEAGPVANVGSARPGSVVAGDEINLQMGVDTINDTAQHQGYQIHGADKLVQYYNPQTDGTYFDTLEAAKEAAANAAGNDGAQLVEATIEQEVAVVPDQQGAHTSVQSSPAKPEAQPVAFSSPVESVIASQPVTYSSPTGYSSPVQSAGYGSPVQPAVYQQPMYHQSPPVNQPANMYSHNAYQGYPEAVAQQPDYNQTPQVNYIPPQNGYVQSVAQTATPIKQLGHQQHSTPGSPPDAQHYYPQESPQNAAEMAAPLTEKAKDGIDEEVEDVEAVDVDTEEVPAEEGKKKRKKSSKKKKKSKKAFTGWFK